MRNVTAPLVLICSLTVLGQSRFVGPTLAQAQAGVAVVKPTPFQLLQSKQIELAKAEIERTTELVAAGALPRIKLEEAEEKLADAQDEVILAKTLYGELPIQDLSQAMADEMVEAAQRRVERQMKKLNQSQKLVDDGIIAASDLNSLKEELSLRRMNLSLSHSRAKLIGELASIAKYEQSMQALQASTKMEPYSDFTMRSMVHFSGNGVVLAGGELKSLEKVFAKHFDRPLPVSAEGQTAVHDALGFDHRGRVDVALNPNEPAGIWLRHYLEAKGVPYYAFLRAIPGKATGAHIHIGPGSLRLHNAD